MLRSTLCALFLAGGVAGQTPTVPPAPPVYTDAERARIVAFWNAPGRMTTGLPPDAAKTGLWQVRLTPPASLWFWNYQNAIGAGKTPPTQDPTAAAPNVAEWEKWIAAKVAYDRWQAQTVADAANAALASHPSAPSRTPAPPAPGLIPAALLAAVGDPPPFAQAVAPLQTQITFEEGSEIYAYADNVTTRPRYAYYRFAQGTVSYGKPLRDLSDAELDPLFAAAGFNASEQRVAKAVSRLEGGFDSVNTYDTGFVSIGFLQFITYDDGKHSLMEVLAREKAEKPDDYARDFHVYGLDVNRDNTLVAIDPGSGAELTGLDAVRKVIEDKRLTAVFQRAGRHSKAFRVAQIEIAKARYWPAQETVAVAVNGQTLSGVVADVVKSEAGMATLFDRKVNRGSLAPFPDVVAQVMAARHLTQIADAAPYEREIITGMKYRANYLDDKTLTQPAAPPAPPSDLAEKTITTKSGLQYTDLQIGGGAKPKKGDLITVHYVGTFPDGAKFDSSRDRNQPFQFTLGVGQVIKGWDEGVSTMRVGGRRRLIVPPGLAYGENGTPGGPIPPNATLIFEIELLSIP